MSFESEIINALKEKYPDAEVTVSDCVKSNRTLRGISVMLPGSRIAPTLYTDAFEKAVNERHLTSAQAIAKMTSIFEDALSRIPGVPDINRETVIGAVQWKLINRGKNTGICLASPYRDFCDLILVPYMTIQMEDGMGSIRITNALMKSLGLSEEEVFAACDRNADPVVAPMKEVIREMHLSDMPKDTNKKDLERALAETPDMMYVCTNRRRTDGAGMFLAGGVMEHMSELMDDNVIILPSSVHEVIMVPESYMGAGYAGEMVAQVNRECVSAEDFLSDNVYIYDREKKEFREFDIEQEAQG